MTLQQECDKLFRRYILESRPSRCEWCGKIAPVLQVAHILPKGAYRKLRYEERNVLLLCFPCHPPNWHLHPLEVAKFIEEYKGRDYRLKLLAINELKSKVDLKMIRAWLKQELGIKDYNAK